MAPTVEVSQNNEEVEEEHVFNVHEPRQFYRTVLWSRTGIIRGRVVGRDFNK